VWLASAFNVQGSMFDVSTRQSVEAFIPLPSGLSMAHPARRRGNNPLAHSKTLRGLREPLAIAPVLRDRRRRA